MGPSLEGSSRCRAETEWSSTSLLLQGGAGPWAQMEQWVRRLRMRDMERMAAANHFIVRVARARESSGNPRRSCRRRDTRRESQVRVAGSRGAGAALPTLGGGDGS